MDGRKAPIEIPFTKCVRIDPKGFQLKLKRHRGPTSGRGLAKDVHPCIRKLRRVPWTMRGKPGRESCDYPRLKMGVRGDRDSLSTGLSREVNGLDPPTRGVRARPNRDPPTQGGRDRPIGSGQSESRSRKMNGSDMSETRSRKLSGSGLLGAIHAR